MNMANVMLASPFVLKKQSSHGLNHRTLLIDADRLIVR